MFKINLLSSNKYAYLKRNILKQEDCFNDIEIETETFPDGEHYWKIINPEQLCHKPAVLIAGTVDDESIFELYNIASTLVREQCSSLHIVIPYFGYSTMERAVKEGDEVHLGRFCILKEYRGIGLGTMTLKMFEYYYYNQGYKHMTLHAIRSAVPLYERCGYTITSDEFMEAGYPHFIMEKYLH